MVETTSSLNRPRPAPGSPVPGLVVAADCAMTASSGRGTATPAHAPAGIERNHPDLERIDPSRPIKSWRSAWRAALKRVGLQIRFHDLRHTCITKLAEGQASEQTIMSIAGHLSRKMLEHYSHIRMAAKPAALDAIAKAVFEVGVVQNPLHLLNARKTTAPN